MIVVRAHATGGGIFSNPREPIYEIFPSGVDYGGASGRYEIQHNFGPLTLTIGAWALVVKIICIHGWSVDRQLECGVRSLPTFYRYA